MTATSEELDNQVVFRRIRNKHKNSNTIQYSLITTPIFCVIVFLLTSSELAFSDPSQLDSVELLDWIGHEGVEDLSWSDERIFETIQQGLSHRDSSVINATIGAMAWIAAYADIHLDDGRSTQRIVRNIGQLSGIKEFLINRWNEEYRENSNPWIGSERTKFVEIRNAKTVWREEWAWLTIPAILATFFRQDPEVVEILWQAHNPRLPELLLSLLNVAHIESKEATEFRVQILFDQTVSPFATVLAIDSLGRFRSTKGLAALVSRLRQDDISYDVASLVLESIGAYGEDTIKPYRSILSSTTRKLGLEIPKEVEVEQSEDELLAYLLFMVKNGYETDAIIKD